MMHGLIAGILSWVSVHPTLALVVVFAVAVGESLFLFGLLVPGAIFMFAFGALIGADALPLVATFVAAVVGTLVGDSASYALGRRYRGRLHDLPGLSRIPGGVARGEAFFARHGGKGIVLGRLIGALRPMMPTVAGAAGVSIVRFAVMETIAALLWAPIYIVPGIVFGTSVGLAAQVATRLAILLIVTAAIVWALTGLTRFVVASGRSAGRRYAEQLMAWSHRHRRLGLLGPALADPRQPEIPALAVAAGLLMVVIAAFHGLLWIVDGGSYPNGFDTLVFYLVDSLRNAPTNTVARMLAVAGSPLIYLPFAMAIAVALSAMGNRRAASHWIAAIVFSSAATLLMRWLPMKVPPAIFFNTAYAEPLYLAGGQDLILCATVYGLAGAIVGARQPESVRPYCYSVTVAGIALIALARLYLGLEWASSSLIALLIAFVWLSLLMVGYRRQRPRRVSGSPVAIIVACCVGIAALFAVLGDYPIKRSDAASAVAPTVIDWRGGGYRRLPMYIGAPRKQHGAPLSVQIAGTIDDLARALRQAGWREPPTLNAGSVLRSLAPDASIDVLPVMPRIHAGRAAKMVWVHPIDASHRWVLRLWPTAFAAMDRHLPIWLGAVEVQRVTHALHILTAARGNGRYRAATRFLAHSLAAHGMDYLPMNADSDRPLLVWPNADAPESMPK